MTNLIGSTSLGVLVSFILFVTIVFMLAKINAQRDVTPPPSATPLAEHPRHSPALAPGASMHRCKCRCRSQ